MLVRRPVKTMAGFGRPASCFAVLAGIDRATPYPSSTETGRDSAVHPDSFCGTRPHARTARCRGFTLTYFENRAS